MKPTTESARRDKAVKATWRGIMRSLRAYVANGNKTNLAYATHDLDRLRLGQV